MSREVCSGKEFNAKYGNIVMVKLLNEQENHNEYQFKEGLNVDTIPFNVDENCCAGGIYFCQFHDMYVYFTYTSSLTKKVMKYVREVTVPDDAIVCIEQGQFSSRIKFKANKIILGKRGLIDIFCDHDVQEQRELGIMGYIHKNQRTLDIILKFSKFLQSHAAKNLLRGIDNQHSYDTQHKVMNSDNLAEKCWLQVLENRRKI